MAIILDERARAAVARRRTRGWDTTLFLRHEVLPVGRGDTLAVGWAPRRWPRRQLEVRQAGDITVVVDRRVAEYTRRHDVTISAWRLGPFEVLLVDDASSVLLEMQEWERTHPDEERLKRRAVSTWDT